MSFLSLPNEILLSVAELGHGWDTASLSQVNRRLYNPLTHYLYEKDARDYRHPILTWAVETGNQYTIRKWLSETVTADRPHDVLHHAMNTAASHGHETVVRLFLESGISPNRPYEYTNPLHYAVANGHISMASMVLAHDAKTTWSDSEILCKAINSEEPLAMVKTLVEEGNFSPKNTSRSLSALTEAALLGETETVHYLLQKGCDVETPAGAGETPICFAAAAGNLEIVHVLLEHGANIDPVLQAGQNMYPLRAAVEWNRDYHWRPQNTC